MSTETHRPARLVADIGGTNARFALARPGGEVEVAETLAVRDFAGFVEAMRTFLDRHRGVASVIEAAIAAAGPVSGGRIALTNAPWVIKASEVSAEFDGAPVKLFNDLEAAALALPYLKPAEFATLAAGRPATARTPSLVVNVGTGFGAAIAVPSGEDWLALSTEAGHMRFAAAAQAETPLMAQATTYEDILSGAGLARLRQLHGDATSKSLFSAILGRVAGDLVLATGAWGGVFFCGGVLEHWDEGVDTARLLEAFRAKGPMSERMGAVPVHRITTPNPAFRALGKIPIETP